MAQDDLWGQDILLETMARPLGSNNKSLHMEGSRRRREDRHQGAERPPSDASFWPFAGVAVKGEIAEELAAPHEGPIDRRALRLATEVFLRSNIPFEAALGICLCRRFVV